jgi:hypothetical protein
MLIDHPAGRYRFLKGIDPYSGGVAATEGHEIGFVTLTEGVAWREGFRRLEGFLDSHRARRMDLCGIQLRCPAPYAIEEFIAFNREYCDVLKEWDLFVGDVNPIARTNVAPLGDPPNEPQLYAFSYVRPSPEDVGRTFVVSGAGELPEGVLDAQSIVRRGETTDDALQEKAAFVMEIMAQRLAALGATWPQVSRVNVYTAHPVDALLRASLLPRLTRERAARPGVHLYPSQPPVREIEFEMDLRGVRCESLVAL